ncbi:glycosyltransferase family 39 protein [uncultured Halorubrum sp.]|uniref:ArnT family glycosyltransferase n=1 Tax=uncultured Halorubrum sp. TaxID=399555 RepID=UPI00260776AD|nr:glycosyltransferase family 39 protein [uncultured Halorubrum sp.]
MSPRSDPSLLARLAARLRQRLARADRTAAAAVCVSLAAGLLTFAVAATVFSHHSANHDEGVYLTQAALLLGGQFEFHAGALADAVHPWFFVEDGGRLYPKYSPVPAATYAASMALFDEPRVTLGAIAAGNAALVYLLGGIVAGRRAGLAAAALFAASPMAILTGAAFLPYAPTTFFNLLFAVAYLRSVRDGSTPTAGVAGVAIGAAFFARPFTAVLFAAPFILHALWRIGSAVAAEGLSPSSLPDPVRRHGLTAVFGMLFVGVTLAYNLRITGSALTFPYQAFAPMDGPGFGERRILGHSAEYTPALALESNGYALWELATRWVAAGPLGTLLAAVGGAVAVRRRRDGVDLAVGGDRAPPDGSPAFRRTAALIVAGIAVSVVVGNLFFWGTHNALATLSDPADGLAALFGPFYHFDLLVPLSVFGGLAVAAGARALPRLRARLAARTGSERNARAVVAVAVAVALVAASGAAVATAADPVQRNAAIDAKHEAAYAPFDDAEFADALVFVPTPYGEWLAHPFQRLRNGPGLDGDAVYALDRDPVEDFAVLDAYPNRTLYRYGYRGAWTADPESRVTPKLEPIDVRSGSRVAAETTVGIPERVESARVRLETRRGEGRAAYDVPDPEADDPLAVEWSVGEDGVRLAGAPDERVAVDPAGDVAILTVTLFAPDGSTFTYRQEATVRTGGPATGSEAAANASAGDVEVVWPPERSVCRLVTDCGSEGTYLPDRPGEHAEWVVFETEAETSDSGE